MSSSTGEPAAVQAGWLPPNLLNVNNFSTQIAPRDRHHAVAIHILEIVGAAPLGCGGYDAANADLVAQLLREGLPG